MSAGLRVLNDSNTIVIDSESTNFAFHSKGTVTTVTPPADVYLQYGYNYISYYCNSMANITLNPAPPGGIFAVQCSANVGNLYYATPYILPNAAVLELGCNGPAGTTVKWWYFAPVNSIGPSNSGAGLRVFNESGALAYDSGHLPIKYVDFISGPGLSAGGANKGPFTYPAGREYALIISCGGGYYGGKKRTNIYVDEVNVGVGGRVNGNVVYTADVPGRASNVMQGLQGNPFYFAWGVIVVDVTNL